MPPRDEQDYESKRQQIIDGALEVFSSKGFEKATNKDIARASHINSPGLIYHYFRDKADLFSQVMEQRASVLEFIMHGDEMMEQEPREVLTRFAQAFFDMLGNPVSTAMLKMMLSEATRKPAVAAMFNKIGPQRGFAFLGRYLQHQMELGKLRRMNVGAAVRCFMGPLLAYVLTKEIFIQADSATLSRDEMVRAAVDLFLEGLGARG